MIEPSLTSQSKHFRHEFVRQSTPLVLQKDDGGIVMCTAGHRPIIEAFICIAPFRNDYKSKETWVENRGQISHILPPMYKLEKGRDKQVHSVKNQVWLSCEPLEYF